MREIIFRGKRVDNGEWVYGDLINDKNFRKVSIIPHSLEGLPVSEWFVEVNPSTVGQYTSIKDCNGKMIFEGDIVKITDHTIEETFESCGALVTMLMTRTYEIFWNVTKWSIKSLEPMLAVYPPIFDLPTNHVTYEIIGTIHEEEKK